jgi:NhaA family Na+:H+ antiporter
MHEAADFLRGGGQSPHAPSVEGVREMQRAAREVVSPLAFLEKTLHPWTSFVIVPLFALANAGVPLTGEAFRDPVALAVGAGLLVGKPIGIVFFSWLAVRIGLADLPEGVGWGAVVGGGFLAGIGFTMSIFIAGLALEGSMLDYAKVGILFASVLAAAVGLALLVWQLPARRSPV